MLKALALFVLTGMVLLGQSVSETRSQSAPDTTVLSLVAAAMNQLESTRAYDGSYRVIAYPGGDVPETLGVCTDLVIRSYRQVGIDLQVEVHEDMTAAFEAYPRRWGQSAPDRNIDHRRVLNLMTFFARRGASVDTSSQGEDFRAGDLVTWTLPGGRPHIGLVTHRFNADSTRPLVVHHLGERPRVEDVLFRYTMTGHFRYLPHRRAQE